MTNVLTHFQHYFKLTEVVSPAVAQRYGNMAWSFIDPRLMEVMIFIREGLMLPITINFGSNTQRGYRENTCEMVSAKTAKGQTYCSAHTMGRAFDMNVKGMSAEDVRSWIRLNRHRLPYPIRIEKGVSWVHIDTMNTTNEPIIEFSV